MEISGSKKGTVIVGEGAEDRRPIPIQKATVEKLSTKYYLGRANAWFVSVVSKGSSF